MLVKKGLELIVILGLINVSFSQNILWDDVNSVHPGIEIWSELIDTLLTNRAVIHYVSEEGWAILPSMDILWLSPIDFYPYEVKNEIINFSRNGGIIFIGCANSILPVNDLLQDTAWNTTLSVSDSGLLSHVCPLVDFPPLTDGVNYVVFFHPNPISCGYSAYPLAFAEGIPIAAISYPFIDEGNCESFIILITGYHSWENGEIHGDAFRFAVNLCKVCNDSDTFGLSPCAVPNYENIYHCENSPNPFTPNFDGINDYVSFGFDEIGSRPAAIYIYDMYSTLVRTIEIPFGAAAKFAARWYGRDNSGKPVPQGVYLFEVEQDGEIICTGTVTVAR